MCLADFINPEGEDWIGGFAVGIHGLEPHLERFKQTVDDYDDILLKALADRLAESLAEVLHAEVRNRLWGYADEHLSNQQLIREKYHGIRPAPGYPACPDHSLKPVLFEMLGGHPGEVTLTENFAMLPTSAVSGFYFGHRDSQYFGVARIGRDQLEDYAAAARGDGRSAPSAGCGRTSTRPASPTSAASMLRRLLILLCTCCSSLRARPARRGIEPQLVAEGPCTAGRRGRSRHPHAPSSGLAWLLAQSRRCRPADGREVAAAGRLFGRAAALSGADAARPSRVS